MSLSTTEHTDQFPRSLGGTKRLLKQKTRIKHLLEDSTETLTQLTSGLAWGPGCEMDHLEWRDLGNPLCKISWSNLSGDLALRDARKSEKALTLGMGIKCPHSGSTSQESEVSLDLIFLPRSS